MSDPGISYRKREEIQYIRKNRDPIEVILKNMILDNNVASEAELKKLIKKLKNKWNKML
jgi:TPP-dependent pyruvate/acetoin dehydrogenase alpha subunit